MKFPATHINNGYGVVFFVFCTTVVSYAACAPNLTLPLLPPTLYGVDAPLYDLPLRPEVGNALGEVLSTCLRVP